MKKSAFLTAMILLVVFSFTMFFITRFDTSTLIARDGFFVSGTQLDEVLLNENKLAKSESVNLEKISSLDTMYVNLDKIYVGEEKKIEVNTIYPLFINNGLGIVNLDDKSKLINKKFELFDTYENFTITGGKLYNFGDFEQADYEDYILLQLSNGTYVNLLDISLETMSGNYSIMTNSIINFQESYINYYYYDTEGKLVYKIIDGLSLDNTISFGKNNYTYQEFLVGIEKMTLPEDDTIIEDEDDSSDDDYIIGENDNNNNTNSGTSSGEKKYVAPKVSVTNFTANVYSADATLSISDPSRVIVGGINFQFFVDDKVFLRKTFLNSGNIEVAGLVPNTTFKIVGTYKYYNEESKKMEMTFFEQELTTLGVENLEPISLEFDNGVIYPNKIELNNLKISSNLQSETVKGVNKAIIIINGEQFSIATGKLTEIINGRSITYTSPAKIESNTVINYEIKLLDAYSNEIKLVNNSGVTRTSKNAPTTSIKVADSAVNEVKLIANLKNIDNVNINDYRYVISDANGTIFEEKSLNSNEDSQEIILKNLNPNTTYSVVVYGNYDIENGQGTMINQVMGEGKFTTSPLSSLGFFRVTATPLDLTSSSVTISSSLDINNVSAILLELLNSLTISITDEQDNIVFTHTYNGDALDLIRSGEEFSIDLDGLSSVTTYNVNYSATVKQGTVVEAINVLCSLKSFKTYKLDAEVQIQKEFVTSNMIDFDVRVVDLDGAIESGRVLLEVRDSIGTLVAKEYLDINADYVQLTYSQLEASQKYTFNYIAEEYNKGFSNATYEGDYKLLSKDIVTEEGISGEIKLINLLRDITGKNLFNLEDYNRIRKEGNTGYKEYDVQNNTVMFGAKNGYVTYSYFLPEAYHKVVNLSFKARYNEDTQNTAPVYISLGYGNNRNYAVTNLTDQYKEYSFTFYSTSNYIGFNIYETANANKKTTVDFKDIQILSLDEEAFLNTENSMSIHPSRYIFSDTIMIDGNSSMPNWSSGGTMIGNAGAGHARITRLSDGKVYEFNYTGSPQTFDVPTSDIYRIECWGAAGGDSSNPVGSNRTSPSTAGRGAYTSGDITLDSSATLYVYVGGAGVYSTTSKAGGWNGGGKNGGGSAGSGSGGGATDVRLINGTWNNLESLQSRIMVAAGGGGSDNAGGTLNGSDDGRGGSGGTLFGLGGYINGVIQPGSVATQVTGNAFGIGANPTTVTDTGGGGGGYYGGLATNSGNGGAAGGSSYISGHQGCISYNNAANFLAFEKYQENSQYQGTFDITIQDLRDEITTNDYYVRVYRKGEYLNEYHYDLPDSNLIENDRQTYGFDKNVEYTLTLSVKQRDRYYDIDSVEFTTETEIRSITTVSEFFAMHPDGKYIVLNDLDFTGSTTIYSSWFYGEIDFQGYHMTRNAQGAALKLFEQFRSSAVIKNLVIDFYFDNSSSREWYYGLITYNYGTVDNVYAIVHEATLVPNYVLTLFCYANYGTISNFVINSKVSVSALAASGLATWSNQGVLRNGYAYGENIYAYHQNVDRRSRKDVAVFAGETNNNSRIENVFSLISVEKSNSYGTGDKELSVGNMVGYHGSGYMGNSYSVELTDKTNTNILTQDPNIGKVSSIRQNNLYYVSDKTYGGIYSNKISKLALYDKNFQNQTLNTYNGFDVDPVDLGYFPQLKLNDCMPKQDWIELPTVTEDDLIDITSIEVVENNGDNAVIKLYINNPSNEQITRMTITDINKIDIINQVNSFGKTTLTVKLSQPRSYKSRYYIDTLWIKPAYGPEYTRVYEKNERSINIDLYYPIYNLNDWKIMVSNPSQNYSLMADLDFKNVASISSYVVNSTFSAKLDGRGHTISNITISSNNGLFNSVTGTIKNLFVKNYKKTSNTSYGGFIYQATTNSVIDNVHIDGCQVYGRDRIGGLVGYSNSMTIRNSSVTGFKPSVPDDQENSYIGGLVGYANLTFIENSYTQDLNINIDNAMSTLGVGGLAGRMVQGTVSYSYSSGTIRTNTINVGGLVGWSSATISNVWSYVNISTELDYVGGIVGKSDNSNVNNTLVAGAIYSRYVSNQGNNIHRTTGNALSVIQSNYAWDKQKFYGYVTGEASAEILVTTESLQELTTYQDLIGFGEIFDYSQIGDSILPKIKNPDTGELLPNQKDINLVGEEFDVKTIEIEPTATNATIHMIIENPKQYEITGIEFDYLQKITERYVNNATDGTTDVYLSVSPTMYFDSYAFNKVNYIDSNGEAASYDKVVRMELQFFKILSSFDGWNQISTTFAENYRITGDIDLSQLASPKSGVIFGRLEGLVNDSGVNYKIMNYTKTGIKASKTNLIRKITTTLKNITFENIDLETTGTASYSYMNVIYLNYSDIENVQFNSITINAPKSSYVAPIGIHRGQNIDNVQINNNNIKGTSYVAGLLASSYNTSSTDVVARDCTIYGSNQYVAGIVAYKDYLNGYNTFRYSGYNMNVTGKTDVGGLFGYAGAQDARIYDSTITGISNGNYVGGLGGRSSYERSDIQLVSGCTIVASSNYVGGLYGWARHMYDCTVENTTITQTNSARTYVGGAFGYQDGYTHSNIGIVNVDITNAGNYTGGITGRLNNTPGLHYVFTNNVTIKGKDYVGGVAGSSNTGRLYYNVTNVNISATGNYVGGVFGYISSIHAVDSAYSAVVYECLVANSVVTGNNYVGGFVGNTNGSQLTPAKFYNILLVVDVNSTASSNVYAGAINGRDNKDYSTILMQKIRLYENNRLNNSTLKALRLPMIPSSNLATTTNLKTQSYYTGFGFSTARWDYANISTSFPRVKTASNGKIRGEQELLPVPTSNIVFARAMREIAPVGHELPKMSAYASGINSINLEFSDTDEYSFFEVYDGETKVFEQNVDERAFTINYDYQSNIKVILSDGRNSKVYEYKASDFRVPASTYNKKYAYIYKGDLKGNVDPPNTKGKFIHIYRDLALTDEMEVVNIITGEISEGSYMFTISLADKTVPLFEFDYKDTPIETYYNYSIVRKDGNDILYNNQILVKNGNIEIVDSMLESYHNMVILDNYSNKDYISVLGTDGSLYDLKSPISIPNNFSNKAIRFISNNIYSDNSAVILIYKTGKVVVFDYRTGKEIVQEKATEDISIVDYFKENFSSSTPLIGSNITSNYQEALDLKELLLDTPIQATSNGSFTMANEDNIDSDDILSSIKKSKNYVTYYNSVRDDYDVLDISSLISDTDNTIKDSENIVTENNKIYTSNNLVQFYMKKSAIKEVLENINGLYIFGALFIGLLGALWLGSRYTKKLKPIEEE